MSTPLSPAAHARLSPSGSKRWFACPGSLTLEAPIPNKSNEYSDDGTAMHEVAAWCLTEHRRASTRIGDWLVVSRDNEPVRKVQFDEDMADLVQVYVDEVRFLGIGNELLIEQRVEFSKFVGLPDQFGTADFICVNRDQGELVVGDLKTGHKFVDVEANSQAMVYAIGALGDMYERAMAQPAEADDDDLSA